MESGKAATSTSENAANQGEDNSMENTKHTKGPWITRTCQSLGLVVCKAERDVPNDTDGGLEYQNIAKVFAISGEDEEAQANARLIAAAPDLLEACKLAEDMCRAPETPQYRQKVWDTLRAAIAKAEGR